MNFSRALLALTLILTTTYALPRGAWGSDKILGGTATIGSLRLRIKDSTQIFPERYDGSAWVPQYAGTAASPDGGSLLHASSGTCYLGLDLPASGITFVQNALTGTNTVTTVVDCTAALVRIEQEVNYTPGTDFFGISWKITNLSSSINITDVRFIHGAHSMLGGSIGGIGSYDSSRQAVSVTQVPGANLRLTLQGIDTPTAHHSASVTMLSAALANFQLADDVDPAAATDNAFALEWQASVLPPDASIVYGAIERIGTFHSVSGVSIDAPAGVPIAPGATVNVDFTVVSTASVPQTVFGITATLPGSPWAAPTFVTALPSILPPLTPVTITAAVTSPAGALVGDFANLVLSVMTASGITDNSTTVLVSPTSMVPPYPILDIGERHTSASARPLLSGTAPPTSQVTVTIDGVDLATVPAGASGAWVYAPTVSLDLGPHSITLSATIGASVPIVNPDPYLLVVTGGGVLDFDGDGVTDFGAYATIGGKVVFRYRRSFDNSIVSASLSGRVPAPEDYDGDGNWDLATLSREGRDFIWTVQSTTAALGSPAERRKWGVRGDTLIIGCHLFVRERASLAFIRGGRIYASDLTDSSLLLITPPLITGSRSYVGCVDTNADGVDEIITAEPSSKEGSTTLKAFTKAGQFDDSRTVRSFSRAVLLRRPFDSSESKFGGIRLGGPLGRTIEFNETEGEATKFSLPIPRKLILTSGTVIDSDGQVRYGLVWQNLASGALSKSLALPGASSASAGRAGSGSRLLLPQYTYPTR